MRALDTCFDAIRSKLDHKLVKNTRYVNPLFVPGL
jgi:hypothetical protein